MSNFLAIAMVTETLRQMLTPPVSQAVSGAEVKTARPTTAGTGLPSKGVNLFLYSVSPNGTLTNGDVPTRDSGGQLLRRPQVALSLHYLLSFYGDDETLEAQRLLGATVRSIHARPLLTRSTIRKTIDRLVSGDPAHFLKTADLAEQIELVKFTPVPLSLEELSKLWSVFFQTNYALSVAYEGNVVLIESDAKPSPSLPVARRGVHVVPRRQAVLEAVDPPIARSGATVTLRGHDLGGTTRVVVSTAAVTPAAGDVKDEAIRITLPATVRAGVNTARVRADLDFGTPNEPHGGADSNSVAFMVQPSIAAIAQNPSTVTEGGIQMKKGEVKITFDPKVSRGQRVEMHLNELHPAAGTAPHAYTFPAPPGNGLTNPADTETATVVIVYKIPQSFAGDYLVRASVDDAQSELHVDPSTGTYDGPVVTL
jgi:hypothetical protein